MKKILLTLALMAAATLTTLAQDAATPAAAPAATPAPPTTEQRLASLEAYFQNTDPAAGAAVQATGVAGPGHNAWLMTSTALVLFMTLPGLFLFYGGLVRRKNILSVIAQCFGIAGLVTILWVVFGYSLVFADGTDIIKGVLGNLKFKMLEGVTSAPNTNYAYWISQNIFSMYQLMFAIITPALILGAVAERMKFSAILMFVGIWMIVVYFPLAHMVWGVNGAMNGVWNGDAIIKSIDFAGGTVVHMSSGWSALILCIILGKRRGFGKESMAPHSMVMCSIGTGMLWVGWYGFNAGSALAADGIATNAFMTTTIATAVACFVWPLCEWITRGKPSVLGFCSGAVAGLVVVTPACGFITAGGALIIGIAAGIVPWFFCYKVKGWFGYDDALDTFGVHAIGGTLGAFLTGILATGTANGNLTSVNTYAAKNGLDKIVANGTLWIEQLKAIGVTLALAIVGTVIIAYLVKFTIGLRPSEENESVGLDLAEHGEEGYHGAGQ
jgi:Amt family ammonium transporter